MTDNHSHHNYIKILKRERAVNPPYLTLFGGVTLAMLFCMCVAACVLYVMQMHDLVVFFSAVVACILGMLSLDYAWALLTWRAFRHRLVCLDVHPGPKHPVVGSRFRIRLELRNSLPWRVLLEALCWDTTAHIRIADALDGAHALAPGACYEIAFQADAVRFGNGRILGVALLLTDRFGLFRYEVHIEQDVQIKVFPERVPGRKMAAFLEQTGLGKRGRSARESEEIDGVRPFMNGDRIKRIVWRGYAKRHELMAFRQARLAHRNAVCLIDAGPHMRVFGKDAPCGLMLAYVWLSRIAAAFDQVSVLAFDEHGAEWLVRDMQPEKALAKLETWLFSCLECSPGHNWAEENWEIAANALYRDFKVYRRVDFSKQSKGRKVIDLAGLLEYARALKAEEMLETGQPEAASQVIKTPYDKVLAMLISQRCDLGEALLSPDPPDPRLDNAWMLLKSCLARQTGVPILWFSCFSSGASETLLREMSGKVSGKHDMVCISLPMPGFALNFSVRKGAAQREVFQKTLGNCAKFFSA